MAPVWDVWPGGERERGRGRKGREWCEREGERQKSQRISRLGIITLKLTNVLSDPIQMEIPDQLTFPFPASSAGSRIEPGVLSPKMSSGKICSILFEP